MMRYAALTLAAAGLASAQTFSACNPVKGDTCPANTAFGGEASYDFRTSKNMNDLESFFIVDGGIKYNPKVLSFSADTGCEMTIFEESNAPTLTSKNYLFFGKVEVELQAAPGRGIVTSIVLQSDALDEIDWEFVGADQTHVQTNFYALGVNDYTRARYYEVPFNPMTSFHTYTIEWTKESIVFSIDGKVYRTATPAEGNYPQTPMQLKLGTWVGGKGTAQGTIDWAGGLAQWNQAPFAGHYRSLKVWDYAGGDKAGAKQYEYSKGSDGKWQTIQIIGAGEKSGSSGSVGDVGNVAGPKPDKSSDKDDKNKAQQSDAPTQSAKNTTTVVQTPTTSAPVASLTVAANTTTTHANGTLSTMTRLVSTSGSPTGSVNAQTTLPSTTTGTPARTSAPAPAAASTLKSSFFVAGIAAMFAALML
ncbi:concanavalin A-like lectin/glucanase domain-containing protein [Colletotrichum acutatum]|uniref:Concanavalin A-like lectin/glucanase domain-containing protein n=1 Tax=Glomerella acutata TaxID=27357 RepID=A0AAD8UL37_GLOAC|nr:concanavalin A-like lectin/glucanase domain-containing protein [Colletotrichum acutatum]KAK1723084.1 concanavalin A-like lectin/glucanase domain-containing protein [Colletotrichum acutatum]